MNETSVFTLVLWAIVQAVVLLAVAPFLSGVTRLVRARVQSRRGPSVLQDYRDIFKLLKRQEVAPTNSGSIFRITPFVLLGTMLVAAMALPMMTDFAPFGAGADIITLIYLFALYRFFFSLSGLDSGSPFAGIGASRELTLGVLVEPILILALIVVALIAGSTNLNNISETLSSGDWPYPLATGLALVACAFATFIEMGKIPFDVAEAEQELQEGPLTEYAGSGLAMMKWALALKQTVMAALFLAIFIPFGKAADFTLLGLVWGCVTLLVKLVIVFALTAVIENTMARGRFLLSGNVTWMGFGVASLAFVFYLTGL